MRWSTRPSVTIRKSNIRNWKVSERIFLYIRNHNWLCKQKKWKLVGSMTSSNADMPISRIRPPSWIRITWLAHFRRAQARYFSSNTTWQRSQVVLQRTKKRWRILGTSFNHGKTRLCRQVGKQDMIQTSEDSKYFVTNVAAICFVKQWTFGFLVTADWTESSRPYL